MGTAASLAVVLAVGERYRPYRRTRVHIGGTTSIDVTKPGIDKAYGIKKLTELLAVTKSDVIFVGDKLRKGGNDYPVKAMGVDCLEVSRWQDTALVIQTILGVT
jgi:phosphomannomutase